MKEIDDVLLDNGNKFITGVVPLDNEDQESGDRAAADSGGCTGGAGGLQPPLKQIITLKIL